MNTAASIQILFNTWQSLSVDELKNSISQYYCVEEREYIHNIHSLALITGNDKQEILGIAEDLITFIKGQHNSAFISIEELLQEYSLSDADGIILMCLAETLLRIPDNKTIDALIEEKLSESSWVKHLNRDNSVFVNTATWGLILSGKIVKIKDENVTSFFKKSSQPIIRAAIKKAMKVMGEYFVLGRTIYEAKKNSLSYLKKGYSYSYDMLGESAITQHDAEKYLGSYVNAIQNMADFVASTDHKPSLSIKLSALHPRFEESQRDKVIQELSETVTSIVLEGKKNNIAITIDAEEADRLELSLDIFEKVLSHNDIAQWGKFGLVVQAYSKRALPALFWLRKLSQKHSTTIPVRLVKGAYWDSEIQHAQVLGLDNYPVFTEKEHTDISYLVCARFLLSKEVEDFLYPQFATHNAYTVSSLLQIAGDQHKFEFQRLHGMGDDLYDAILQSDRSIPIRIYAPIGSHEDLLPYLVRRLLENGANSSFVHKLSDKSVDTTKLTKHPEPIKDNQCFKIILPKQLFNDRDNSSGINLSIASHRLNFMESIHSFSSHQWLCKPIINGQKIETKNIRKICSPYNHDSIVGWTYDADIDLVKKAVDNAVAEFDQWKRVKPSERAQLLLVTADLIDKYRSELISLCIKEAGKTYQDSIDEIREAIDFCRYYAQQAIDIFGEPVSLPGPTGESNSLYLEGKGVFVCISPWNFPLAIFVGQIAAALVTGNTVIAKPAETTSLIAYRAIELFLEAGIPKAVLQFIPGSGMELGGALSQDSRIAGVAFTGSELTARHINRSLANRETSIATLIAETGGINAMIVDSTALPEQVATDVIKSAFSSAGQRCSALRILYLQDDIADRVIELIHGAMTELVIGSPEEYKTDVGPVIDSNAYLKLNQYIKEMQSREYDIFQVTLPSFDNKANFIAPTTVMVNSILDIQQEMFGPILHIARYNACEINDVIDIINSRQYGLTLGIHTRSIKNYENIASEVKVGNVYINRNQIGAVVGVNPFGGRDLSGTGPKAGGPHYLLRFVTEKTITINTTAIGGNIDLLNQI